MIAKNADRIQKRMPDSVIF